MLGLEKKSGSFAYSNLHTIRNISTLASSSDDHLWDRRVRNRGAAGVCVCVCGEGGGNWVTNLSLSDQSLEWWKRPNA